MGIRADYRNRELSVRLSGTIEAETLLENLSSHLQLAREGSTLLLDLSEVRELGDLAHSALVVLLRSRCGRFRRIELSGLRRADGARSWIAGGRGLLGAGWEGGPTAEGMCFVRQEGERA